MSAHVARLDLSMRRRSMIGYTLGMAVYVLVVVALYPAFKDSTSLDDLTKSSAGVAALFGISGSLTSPTGWLNANVYANFLPLVLLLLAVGYGGSALAGQEHDGHLELVLSLPVTRGRLVGQKILAMVAQVVVVATVVFACVLVGRGFDLDVDVAHLGSATAAAALLGLDFGLLALVLGGASGSRGMAIGVTSGIAAACYLVSSMAPVVSWLDPVKYVSPFYWGVGNDQLDHGASVGSAAVLIGLALVLGAASVAAFGRHDLS
jgi:ABC-2 type transport system permease protein